VCQTVMNFVKAAKGEDDPQLAFALVSQVVVKGTICAIPPSPPRCYHLPECHHLPNANEDGSLYG